MAILPRTSTNIALSRISPQHHGTSHTGLQPQSDPDTPVSASGQPRPPSPHNNPPSNAATIEDVPPDGGYGWVCTACVFVMNVCTWGVNSSWGVFLDRYVVMNTFPEATKFEYAIIGGLSISQALIISPVSAACQKRIGTRFTMLLGSALVFASIFAASSATRIWHLFLSFGFCFGWGMGMVYIPSMALLPPWFSSHRSLAVGLATSGSGIGGLAYSLLAGRLIALSGVAWAWRIISFTTLAANIPAALLVRERPSSASPTNPASTITARTSPRYAFTPRSFLRTQIMLILAWGFLTEFGYVALWYSLPSYATSAGLDPAKGSVVQALLSLGLGIGRPVVGYYSDRVGRINMALGMTTLCGVLCLALWIPVRSYAGLLVFAAAGGVMGGTFWATVNPILAEVVGIAEAGSTFGAICFALVLPTTFGEAIALQLAQGEGSRQFLPSQVFVGSMFLAGATFLWGLRSWKICEIEKKLKTSRGRP
ncbi:hypothetical protein VTK26DRAFT_4485 [Humicola hyalothermophila]